MIKCSGKYSLKHHTSLLFIVVLDRKVYDINNFSIMKDGKPIVPDQTQLQLELCIPWEIM